MNRLAGKVAIVTGAGRGIGREYALALAIALRGAQGVHALACDTDGVDGAAEVARVDEQLVVAAQHDV